MKVCKSSKSLPMTSSIIYPFLCICQPVRATDRTTPQDFWQPLLQHLPIYVSEFLLTGCEQRYCGQLLHYHLKSEAACPCLPPSIFTFHWLACGLGSDLDMDNTLKDDGATGWKEPPSLKNCHKQSLPHKSTLLTFGLLGEKKEISSLFESLPLWFPCFSGLAHT